ncbi:MAG: hypothetical protein N3A02_05515 [Rectinema sp.]|nr:hypothetical protein [Rectinema sp.]
MPYILIPDDELNKQFDDERAADYEVIIGMVDGFLANPLRGHEEIERCFMMELLRNVAYIARRVGLNIEILDQ